MFVRLEKRIQITVNGKDYDFPAGSVINIGKYPGIEKHIGPGYSTKVETPGATSFGNPKGGVKGK